MTPLDSDIGGTVSSPQTLIPDTTDSGDQWQVAATYVENGNQLVFVNEFAPVAGSEFDRFTGHSGIAVLRVVHRWCADLQLRHPLDHRRADAVGQCDHAERRLHLHLRDRQQHDIGCLLWHEGGARGRRRIAEHRTTGSTGTERNGRAERALPSPSPRRTSSPGSRRSQTKAGMSGSRCPGLSSPTRLSTSRTPALRQARGARRHRSTPSPRSPSTRTKSPTSRRSIPSCPPREISLCPTTSTPRAGWLPPRQTSIEYQPQFIDVSTGT